MKYFSPQNNTAAIQSSQRKHKMRSHCLKAATFKADFEKNFLLRPKYPPSFTWSRPGCANLPRAAHNKEPMHVRQSTSASVASKKKNDVGYEHVCTFLPSTVRLSNEGGGGHSGWFKHRWLWPFCITISSGLSVTCGEASSTPPQW